MELRGLHSLRIVVIVAMMGIIALAAGDVFDRLVWWFLLAPCLVGALALGTMNQRWAIRFLAAFVGVLASTATIIGVSGGSGADVATSFGAGLQRLLSTDWPSPDRSELLGTVAVGLGLATALGAELARRSRLHLAPLLPVGLAGLGVIALSAPLGLRLRWLIPVGAIAIFAATLRPGQGVELRERLTLLRGERRLVPVSLIAIGMAAALTIPIAFASRDDPRRNEPAERSAALLDPIEATLALQAIQPPIDLHEIGITQSSAPAPLRWRTAALTDYNGRRWSPELTLRPIGRRLDASSPESISATVSFLDDALQLVPLPGAPIVVDATIETDADRTIVRLVDRPTDGDSYSIESRVEPSIADVAPGSIGTREVDERVTGLDELAAGFVTQGGANDSSDLLAQLVAIETAMSNDFVLRADASGGGLQQALIERFLRDTQRGNAEQFSTAYVLLARSLGVDARVATGFEVEPERLQRDDGVTRLTLRSDDARIWPEVRVGDRWVAFDPVPATEDSDAIPPPPEPQVQTPAAPQPPIALPPESADEPIVTDDDADDAAADGLPTVVAYALASVVGVAVLLVPMVLLIAVILGVKWRRRRRLLTGLPAERIRGAWAVATNHLVDAGMAIDASDTNNDIALEATGHVPTAHREIRRLATLASATTFGSPARPDLLAQDAAVCLGEVETSMTESRSFWERLRWRLSMRSLRRSTASPV